MNFADDTPGVIDGNKSDSSIQRFIDEGAHVIARDFVRSSGEAASSLACGLIKRHYPVNVAHR